MLESLFFVIFHYGPFLLALTFVPALAVGLLCGWRMAGMTWKKGTIAGLAGSFVGVSCSVGWYGFTFVLPPNDVIAGGYVMLPVPSAATAWLICRLWVRWRHV